MTLLEAGVPLRQEVSSATLQPTPSPPEFSKGDMAKGSAARATACLRFNEYNQYSDVCVSIINLLLLVQLFGTELISRALYQSFDYHTCHWFPSLLPSLPRAAFPLAIPSWASVLQELRSASGSGFAPLLHFVVRQCLMLHICHVALHAAVIVLACTKPAAYARHWRCPLMLLRRLLMPLTHLAVALSLEPSKTLAFELLGDNRLVSTTVEVGLQTVMYPVPLLWHLLSTAARMAIQAVLVARFAPIYHHDPLAIIVQLLASFVVPSALVLLTQDSRVAAAPATPPPGTSKLAPPPPAAAAVAAAAFPAKPLPPIIPRIVPPTAENVAAAAAAEAAAGDDAADAVCAAQRKQRRPPPRQRSLLAASETDSLVSPREAAAAAAAAAAGAAEVAVDAPRHSSRPPPRRQRSMYKPRIRPALLISVKMHHSPDVNFDNLAPALRQSALKALHKYDCDSILPPGASTAPAAAGPSTSAGLGLAAAPPAAAAPALSPLQVQSACIPGCVQLLLGAWGPAAEERAGWLAAGAERGLAEALYRGVRESPEGRLLGRVVVQVGDAGFTFEDGRLVKEGTVEEVHAEGCGSVRGSQQQAPTPAAEAEGDAAAGPQWVWPAWVPESSGEVEFQCGTCGDPASLAGRAVRVVVTEGAAGRVVLDRDGVVAGDDGIVRFTMPAPPRTAACRVFLLAPSAALLLSAPLLALPPACCAELHETHACILADATPPHTPADAPADPPSTLPPPIPALLPLLPALTDLATGLLALPSTPTPAPSAPAPPCDRAAAAEAAATLTHLADYFFDNDLLSCFELATACALQLQHLALTQAPTPTAASPPTSSSSSASASHSASPPHSPSRTPSPSMADHGTHADPSPCGPAAADAPSKPAPAPPHAAAPPASTPPHAPPQLGTIWGFADAATREQYQQYKAVHASRLTDCLMGVSCAISLAASVLFRSSFWQLWLAVDLVKVLQFALLLSGARPSLWRWRDTILCGTRAGTALALAAATCTGLVPVGSRSHLSLGLECHLVMFVCGVLRPLLYQVSVSPAMLLAVAAEGFYALLVYSPACGVGPTAARCSVGTALGIAAALALDLRCRLHYLQLAHTLRTAPATLTPHAPACAAAAVPTGLLGGSAPDAKVKVC